MAEIDKFWQEVINLLDPIVEKKLSYRLYYDDDGNPLFYSMDDLVGNYIEVSQEIFALANPNVKVKDGKLIKIDPKISYKLILGTTGVKTNVLDITVVTDSDPYIQWNIKNYDADD